MGRLRNLSEICLLSMLETNPIQNILQSRNVFNTIFTSNFFECMTTENQALALLFVLKSEEFAISRNILAEYASRQNLNFIISSGSFAGTTVAFHLSKSYIGREILLMEDARLCHLISTDTLNGVIQADSKYDGESVALHMSLCEMEHCQLSETCRLADRINAETLNFIIRDDHSFLGGASAAAALCCTCYGRSLLRQNGGRLYRLYTVEILNSLITLPDRVCTGCSIAFILLHFGIVGEFACIVPKLSSQTLNRVLPISNLHFSGQSVALYLSDVSMSFMFRVWTPMLNAECLNAIVTSGPYRGNSVVCRLARYDISVLTDDAYRIGDMIRPENIQSIGYYDGGMGESLVYWLCVGGDQGLSILAMNDFYLARYITAEVLNSVVCVDKVKRETVAYRLVSGGALGLHILSLEDFRLARLITSDTLNRLVGTDELAGESVALCLVSESYAPTTTLASLRAEHIPSLANFQLAPVTGWDILRLDDYHLARQISEETLCHVVQSYGCMSQSVAFWLAVAAADTVTVNRADHSILALDNCRLARALTHEVLNTICNVTQTIPIGDRMLQPPVRLRNGESVAFWLSSCELGLVLLELDEYRLGRGISSSTLNKVVRSDGKNGQTVGFLLSQCDKGCCVLDAGNGQLRSAVVTLSLQDLKEYGFGDRKSNYSRNVMMLIVYMLWVVIGGIGVMVLVIANGFGHDVLAKSTVCNAYDDWNSCLKGVLDKYGVNYSSNL